MASFPICMVKQNVLFSLYGKQFCFKKKQNFNFIDINTFQRHGKKSYTNMQLSVILYTYSQDMNNLQESNP